MIARALLGIDLGTTLLKAAAVDARSGRVLATAASALPIRAAADGQREQSAASIVRSLRDVVQRLRAALGGTWSTIGGVGLAAQGGSAILMDRHTGNAHTPVQLWNDTRPLGLLAEIARCKPRSYWQRLSYVAQPGAGLARIRWLQQKHPALFRPESLYGGLGEYVYFQLTGAWRQDAGNALQIGCYDARRRVLTAEPLRLVGRDLSFVAPMRQDHETHPLSAEGARLLHLPAGLPVAGPYMDHEAGYLSAVGTSQRPLQCSLGTAWVGNYVLESRSPTPSAFQLVLPSPVGAGRLILRVMAAGNVSWDWALMALTGGKNVAAALRRAEAVFSARLLPPEGLVAMPWLTRPNLCSPETMGAGGFLGVNPQTTPDDLLRALAAGMCFEFARVLTSIEQRAQLDSVILAGGASKGRHFRRILSALFYPLAVFNTLNDDAGGLRGSLYAFSRAAARCNTRKEATPSPALIAQVRERFEEYCRMRKGLTNGFEGTDALFVAQAKKGKGT